jgi:hypothetical protein
VCGIESNEDWESRIKIAFGGMPELVFVSALELEPEFGPGEMNGCELCACAVL